MIDVEIQKVSSEDLARLKSNGVAESRSLEYKEGLPGNTDSEKKEFLADVSAFANATGGDVLYGIAEARANGKPTGVIEAIEGLNVSNRDAELQRLENVLRDGIAPRIPGIRFRWVDGPASGPVLLVRIPRSWAGPHMVVYQRSSRFYSRNANGKYQLDVFEIRSAFLGSGSVSERAREFRAERLGRILAGDTRAPMASEKFICVHAMPHAALVGGSNLDLRQSEFALQREGLLAPFGGTGYSRIVFNVDGLLTYNAARGSKSWNSYLQLFRSGIVETVDADSMTNTNRPSNLADGVGAGAFSRDLFQFIDQAERLWRTLQVEAPASIFVSLFGVKGAKFYERRYGGEFDRDEILLPEILLTDFQVDPKSICRPVLDTLWQAAGLSQCGEYDDVGDWIGDRR